MRMTTLIPMVNVGMMTPDPRTLATTCSKVEDPARNTVSENRENSYVIP